MNKRSNSLPLALVGLLGTLLVPGMSLKAAVASATVEKPSMTEVKDTPPAAQKSPALMPAISPEGIKKITEQSKALKTDLSNFIKQIEATTKDVKDSKILVPHKNAVQEYCKGLLGYVYHLHNLVQSNQDFFTLDSVQMFTIDAMHYYLLTVAGSPIVALDKDVQDSLNRYDEYAKKQFELLDAQKITIDDLITTQENRGTQITSLLKQVESEIKDLRQLSAIYTEVKGNLNILIQILNSVNINLRNDNITIENKSDFQEQCHALIGFANKLRESLSVPINFEVLHLVQYYTQEITRHFATAFSMKNPVLAPFDIRACEQNFMAKYDNKMDRLTKKGTQVDFKTLLKDLEETKNKNKHALNKLTKTTGEFGLTIVNKTYRKFNEWVIEPTIRHNYHKKAAFGLAGFTMLAIAWKYLAFKSSDYLNSATYAEIEKRTGVTRAQIDMEVNKAVDIQNNLGVDAARLHVKNVVEPLEMRLKAGEREHINTVWGLPRIINGLNTFVSKLPFLSGHTRTLSTQVGDDKGGKPAPISRMNDVASGVIHGNNFALSKLWALSVTGLTEYYYQPVTNTIYEWALGWHYHLLGGAYKKRLSELKNSFLESNVLFDDLVGHEEAKKVLKDIIEYCRNPEFCIQNDLVPAHRGVLFIGKPGTGKSRLVEALIGEMKKMFKDTGKKATDFNAFAAGPYYFQSPLHVKYLFYDAQRISPCIVFIDEIDMHNLNRTGNTAVLQELTTQMSGSLDADPNKVVIVIAATNNPQTIDGALKRDGRFGTHLYIDLPGFNDRREFFRRKLSGLSIAGSIDLNRLAAITEGQTYPAITSAVNMATWESTINHVLFTQDLLENQIEIVMRRVESTDSKQLPEDEQRLVALHQAGHALAMLLMPSKRVLDKVNIKPFVVRQHDDTVWRQAATGKGHINHSAQDTKRYGNVVAHHRGDTHGMNSHAEQVTQCKIALAGNAVEQILYGACGHSYKDDSGYKLAFNIAQSMIIGDLNQEELCDELRAEYQKKTVKLLEQYEQEVYKMLSAHKDQLTKIIAALLSKKELSREQLCALIGINDPENPHQVKVNADPLAELPTA